MSHAAVVAPARGQARAQPGHRETADRLLSALRGDEFVLYAQPILPATPRENEPACQEILVRFLEEEVKLLPPGSFFPILESYGLMALLDRWVVNRTIRWLRRQRPARPAPRSVINLSIDSLQDSTFAPFLAVQIERGGICGAALALEIGWADALAHRDQVRALAEALKPLGCGLSLSSYEGAPGSITELEALSPTFVKIGGNLIGRMDRDPMEAATVEGIIGRCRDRGIRTIAEHIERHETLELVRAAGVDYVQGFLVGVPGALA